jgi:hypothetical protein
MFVEAPFVKWTFSFALVKILASFLSEKTRQFMLDTVLKGSKLIIF